MINNFRSEIKEILAGMEKVLPARITQIDSNNLLTVKVLIPFTFYDPHTGYKFEKSRPAYKNIRAFNIKAGNFTISLPLEVGDKGVLIAFDKNCKRYLNGNGEESPASDLVNNSFNSSFFIPLNFFNVDVKNTPNLQVKLNNKAVLEINAETNSLDINGDVNIKGKLIATEDIVAGAISLKNHTHNYKNNPLGQGLVPAVTNKANP